MSDFCEVCKRGEKFIAKTCPWVDCKFNKRDNNDKKDRDGGKKDEQTNYSI